MLDTKCVQNCHYDLAKQAGNNAYLNLSEPLCDITLFFWEA